MEVTQSKGQFIHGKFRKREDTFDYERHCPWNGELIWQGQEAYMEDVRDALISARQASYCWRKLSRQERIKKIDSLQEELQKLKTQLVEAVCFETGKAKWESELEIKGMFGKLELTKQAYEDRAPDIIEKGKQALYHKPHGVLAIFGPFNFPLHISHGQIIPAILAGNTVLFKPSEWTPLSAQLYAQALHNSMIPPGVVNIVYGGASVAKEIIQHPQVDGLLFTGSSEVGRNLSNYFGRFPQKILALEMGGSNPMIIGEHIDRKAAMYHLLVSAFITTGQRCTCARRAILVRSSTDNLWIERFVELAQRIVIGAPYDFPIPFMGPLVSKHAQRAVLAFQNELLDKGGSSLLEARVLAKDGHWITPGIVKIDSQDLISDKECFGPLLQICFAGDLQEAIDIANETPYGLSASLISDQEHEFDQMVEHARAGILNWNMPSTGALSSLPFGGIGLSGNHRPGGYYMIDSCVYPIASQQQNYTHLPSELLPGIPIN